MVITNINNAITLDLPWNIGKTLASALGEIIWSYKTLPLK